MNPFKGLKCLTLALACAAYSTVPVTAGTLTKLYQFSGGADGGAPSGPLRLDSAGNLYGTTSRGGSGNGVIFRLTPAANAPWAETVLYTFSPTPVDMLPNGGLYADANGALYGTAFENLTGFAYRLEPPASGNADWRFTHLFAFPGTGSPRGGGPSGLFAVDGFGDLVGVTQAGGGQSGPYPCQCGVVYALTRPGGGGWQERVLYTFSGLPDGNIPIAGLTRDAAGALYGATLQGGFGQCLDGSGVYVIGCGTVFKLTPAVGSWVETQLYSFRVREGNQPTAPVVIGPDGALYGVAGLDVFRLAPDHQGVWHKKTIYSFSGGFTGTAPEGGVLFDPAGNIFGAARSFGLEGPGLVYRLTPPATTGESWSETTLATVTTSFDDSQPSGGLVRGQDGTLYGVAARSNTGQPGYIFAVSP